MRAWFAAGALGLALALPAARAAAPDAREASKLHALLDAAWDDTMRRSPEWATSLGDLRYNDRLEDRSPAARAAADRAVRRQLAQARGIARERLSPQDSLSLDLFIHWREDEAQRAAFAGYRNMTLGSLDGPQMRLAQLAREAPVDTALHARQLIRRFAAYPRAAGQDIAQLREAMALGWVPARDVLDRALAQLDAQLAAPVEASPWYEGFAHLPGGIASAEQRRLQAAAKVEIGRSVIPALKRLRAFVADELVPRAPAEGGLLRYSGGAKVYAWLVRSRTTTSLTPDEVHEIGLREVAALRAEMDAVVREVKFDGDIHAFIRSIESDPRFFHDSPEALLAGYRAIGARIDAALPRWFAELPRAPYAIRAMPAYLGPDAAEYYDAPAIDGSRPGYFNANAEGFRKQPKWAMATVVAHEAVPGHHLQTARAQEMTELPAFRRHGEYIAYVEGWALYAETLAREMGIFDDPYTLFGHLQQRAFRAARLVVDTGIHAKGWTRQRAIDYMVERTGMHRDWVESEVDRYVSDPGQALGYMIGALEFKALRERARAKLGERFDVRRFHNVVLDAGPLPLDLLDRQVEEWIEHP